jgi:hypothetical protein
MLALLKRLAPPGRCWILAYTHLNVRTHPLWWFHSNDMDALGWHAFNSTHPPSCVPTRARARTHTHTHTRTPSELAHSYTHTRTCPPTPAYPHANKTRTRSESQVKRLLRMLYDPRHIFMIHVDSRSDHMHRRLTEVADAMGPNVWLTSWRMATIWGGLNLYQMYVSKSCSLCSLSCDHLVSPTRLAWLWWW